MGHPSKGLTGAVVAVYIAGEASVPSSKLWRATKLGRIRFTQLMCVIVTIGTTIQTASMSIGMFLAGRTLAGFAVGALIATVPIYLSEIAAPHQRGLIGEISGCGISLGIMMSQLGRLRVQLPQLRAKAVARAPRHPPPCRSGNLHAQLAPPARMPGQD